MTARPSSFPPERLPAPVVARWGTGNPVAPLIVAMHGDGASENSMVGLAPFLPHGPAYAAVRAPLAHDAGFAWFTEQGPGRPLPESLAAAMSWFVDWLDTEGDPDRPVIVLGFGGGAALAGGLMLSRPERFAAGVLLHAPLPFDAGVPGIRGRLAGMPVFLAHGRDDTAVPADLAQRTWGYLVRESGAPLWAVRPEGGHQLAGSTVGEVAQWLGERLDYLRGHGENPVPDGEDQEWPTLPRGRLPQRRGEPPEISVTTPQQQESQIAPVALQEALHATMVEFGEFAHLHPHHDGSLHLVLPAGQAYDALAKGWAAAHPLAGIRLPPGLVMVFGPRDEAELEVVAAIVRAAHAYASAG